MELVVDVLNYDHAVFCIENNVDNIILSNELYSSQYSYSFNEQEVQKLIKIKNKTKIWIKVDIFFYEQDINRLICYLRWLSRLDIDYIIFQDYAVAQINEEYNLNLKLHYGSQTLNVSSYQFDFFGENNINSLFLAREISFSELTDICRHKKNIKVEIHGHGYSYMMYSRWKMITNFETYYNLKNNNVHNNLIEIKEELRKFPNLLIENRHGTHMYTGYLVYSIDLLKKIKDIGVDYLRIDLFDTNYQYAVEITKYYLEFINKEIDQSNLKKFINLHNENNLLISHGFLAAINKLPTLQKEEDEK